MGREAVRPASSLSALIHLIPSCLVCSEIESTMHVALPKQPINQFKPVDKSKQQALRPNCPNMSTVPHTMLE